MDRLKVYEFVSTLCSGLELPIPDPEGLVEDKNFILVNIDTEEPFSNTRLPTRLPLILSKKRDLIQDDFDELRYLITSKGKSGNRVALLVFWGNEELLDRVIATSRDYKEAYAFDILPLGKTQLMELLASEKPHLALRHLVLSQVNLKTVSPFTITGPAPDNVFFGREKEIYQILQNIDKTSFAIIGGRRIGKTSILSHLYRIHLPKAGYYSTFLDCQLYKTSEDLLKSYISFSRQDAQFEKSRLQDLSVSSHRDNSLIMLIDETDKILPFEEENGWPLFRTLRAFANTNKVSVIISGERGLKYCHS